MALPDKKTAQKMAKKLTESLNNMGWGLDSLSKSVQNTDLSFGAFMKAYEPASKELIIGAPDEDDVIYEFEKDIANMVTMITRRSKSKKFAPRSLVLTEPQCAQVGMIAKAALFGPTSPMSSHTNIAFARWLFENYPDHPTMGPPNHMATNHPAPLVSFVEGAGCLYQNCPGWPHYHLGAGFAEDIDAGVHHFCAMEHTVVNMKKKLWPSFGPKAWTIPSSVWQHGVEVFKITHNPIYNSYKIENYQKAEPHEIAVTKEQLHYLHETMYLADDFDFFSFVCTIMPSGGISKDSKKCKAPSCPGFPPVLGMSADNPNFHIVCVNHAVMMAAKSKKPEQYIKALGKKSDPYVINPKFSMVVDSSVKTPALLECESVTYHLTRDASSSFYTLHQHDKETGHHHEIRFNLSQFHFLCHLHYGKAWAGFFAYLIKTYPDGAYSPPEFGPKGYKHGLTCDYQHCPGWPADVEEIEHISDLQSMPTLGDLGPPKKVVTHQESWHQICKAHLEKMAFFKSKDSYFPNQFGKSPLASVTVNHDALQEIHHHAIEKLAKMDKNLLDVIGLEGATQAPVPPMPKKSKPGTMYLSPTLVLKELEGRDTIAVWTALGGGAYLPVAMPDIAVHLGSCPEETVIEVVVDDSGALFLGPPTK